jgi:hypothetical protein
MFNVGRSVVQVVTWMEEEAGAKAAREKVRLGNDRKGPKLLGSFKAILFKSIEVLLCPVRLQFYESIGREKSWRISYTEQTTDFGVLCIRGHFQCRICLVELHIRCIKSP